MSMLVDELPIQTAERQWRILLERRPDLEPAIAVQRRLLRRALTLGSKSHTFPAIPVTLTPDEVARKLSEGRPVLIGENIETDGAALTPYLLGFCDDLESGSAGRPAGRLRNSLEHGDIDCGSLISASLTRRREAILTKAHHLGVAPDLLWLVAELAAGPIAHHFRRALLPSSRKATAAGRDGGTSAGMPNWQEGYCPACGSWPAFAERYAHALDGRLLRCSFCGCDWPFPTGHCVYCDAKGASVLTAGPGDDGQCLVDMCRDCGGYLKRLKVDGPIPFALLPVEDLRTCDLDVSAAERGYGRPPLPEFAGAAEMPCPPVG